MATASDDDEGSLTLDEALEPVAEEPVKKGSSSKVDPPPKVTTDPDTAMAYFGPKAGDVVGEYSCKHRDFQGTLFVASKAVCFRSTGFFGIEQCKIIVPYGEVTGILHDHAHDDAIIVRTEKKSASGVKERFTFTFGGLCDRNTVYNLVLAIYEKADPVYFKSIRFQDSVSVPPTTYNGRSLSDTVSVRKSMMKRKSLTVTSPIELDKTGNEMEASEQDYLAACAAAAMADFSKSQMILVQEMQAGKLTDAGEAAAEKYGKEIPQDLGQAWINCRDCCEPPFENIVYENVSMPCSLDEFFDLFFSDGASHSMAAFQQHVQGDLELETSSWTLSDDDGFSLCRKISYSHPVNAPMAPPFARATKEQCFRRYGDNGICLETQTYVNDVPMTDCFFVEDQVLAEPSPEGGISVTSRFAVRFVKRTMFRKIIFNTASSECKSFFKLHHEFMSKALSAEATTSIKKEIAIVEEEVEGEEVVLKKEPLLEHQTPSKVAEPSLVVDMKSILVMAIVVAVVFMQVGLMLQIRDMNQTISQMNENQNKVLELIGEVIKSGENVQTCKTTE